MSEIPATVSVAQELSRAGVAYAWEIASAAARHGVDSKLLAAIAAQETGGPGTNAGRNIVGDGGHGRGLFQIDDRYHDFARSAAAMDPARNADYAANMVSGLLHEYHGNVREALSAYNAGSPNATGTITEWMDGQRLSYADSVLRHCEKLGERTPAGIAGPVDTTSFAPSDFRERLIEQLVQEISQANALRSFQSATSLDGTVFSPSLARTMLPSYAQLSGLDPYGHSRYDASYAGLLSDDTSS